MKAKLIYILLIFAVTANPSINQLSAQCCANYQSVNCPAGADWHDSKRAVGKMFVKGVFGVTNWTYYCTGSLVNDAGMSGKDYFVSAGHCFFTLSTSELQALNANNIKIVWGEEVGCEDVCQPYEEQHVTYGANFVKLLMNSIGSKAFDIILFELPTSPRDLLGFHPYYSGWNITRWNYNNAQPKNAVGIHYPLDKRLCISTDDILGYSTTGGCSIFDLNPRWSASYSAGENVDYGSSGSPLFDDQKNLIGTLSCSPQSCSTNQYVSYSNFDAALRIPCEQTEHTLECDLRFPVGEDYLLTSVSGVDDLCPLRFKLAFDCDKFKNCSLKAEILEGQPPYTYSWNTGQTTQAIILYKGQKHYRVEVTDANGCVAYASGYFEGLKYKIKDLPRGEVDNTGEISAYPIPANNWLNVDWSSSQTYEAANEGSIRIYDLTGRSILSTKTSAGQVSAQLNVSDLPIGVYFLKVEEQGQLLHSQKVTIQR